MPTTLYIKTPEQLSAGIRRIEAMNLPLSISISKGVQRTKAQNNTVYMWYLDAARALEETPESIRAQCKLEIGVPILRSDDHDFRQWYDKTFRPFSHQAKLEFFERFEPAITSKMKVKQLTRYMDAMQKRFASMGIVLRDPELIKYGEMRQ